MCSSYVIIIQNNNCITCIYIYGALLIFCFLQAISSKGKSLGRAYSETNFPVSQLGEFIRLCLTDTNFPNFVETVEREMANITK